MAASISATLIPCLKSFNHIQELVEQVDYRYESDVAAVTWTDELGRLRVWAANIGAHQTGQSSLEFRLRDASHISQQITKLLKDLENVLRDVEDELCDDQIEASQALVSSMPDDTYADDEDLTSEIKQLYDEVVNIVDCLYKMSMLIRRPAQHDVLIGSHKSDAAAFEPFDKEHVRNKFSDIDDETAQRLGRAITQRRKYLKYRDRHHAKLGKGIEEVQGIQGFHRAPTQSGLSETIATDFKNQNIDFEDATSNSGVSQTSYAPSLMDGGPITMPPPPKESAAGKPFECPYCFFLIDIKGSKSWTRHVFKDIKPYVCTFSDCSIPERLYESRREWFFHMTTRHHVEDLTCPLCKDCLTSSKQFERHVARHLEELALFALPRSELDDESDEDGLEARAPTDSVPVDGADEGSSGTASDQDSEYMDSREHRSTSVSSKDGEIDSNAVAPFASESQDALGTQTGHEDLWQQPREEFLTQQREEGEDKGYWSTLPVPKPSETSRSMDLDAYEDSTVTDAETKPRNVFSSYIEDGSNSDIEDHLKRWETTNEQAKNKRVGELDEPSLDILRPTYIKVHRKHLSPETLDAHELPWEWDSRDSNYIIIKRWIPGCDQDVLFEYERKLRKGQVVTENVKLDFPALRIGHETQKICQVDPTNSQKPAFIKVYKKYITPETLDVYNIPWEWDKVDPEVIIIKRWISEYDREALFDHTRKLRESAVLSQIDRDKPHEGLGNQSRKSEHEATRESPRQAYLDPPIDTVKTRRRSLSRSYDREGLFDDARMLQGRAFVSQIDRGISYEGIWDHSRTSKRQPTRRRPDGESRDPSVSTVRTRRRSLSGSYDRRDLRSNEKPAPTSADSHLTDHPVDPAEMQMAPETFYEKTAKQSHEWEDKPTLERGRRRGVALGAQDIIEMEKRGENITGGIVDQEMTAAAREALNAMTAKYKMQKAGRDKALELI